jgi:hypothetical protein
MEWVDVRSSLVLDELSHGRKAEPVTSLFCAKVPKVNPVLWVISSTQIIYCRIGELW